MKKHATWIVVVAVIMMLAAMFAYVVSDDEAIGPVPVSEETNQ